MALSDLEKSIDEQKAQLDRLRPLSSQALAINVIASRLAKQSRGQMNSRGPSIASSPSGGSQ